MDTNTQTKKVLIVDDNPLNAKLTAWWCNKWGYSTDKASTGDSALKKACQNDYSLIIMDLFLPDMLGVEVSERLYSTGYKTKFVFHSAISKNEFIKRYNTNELFIAKPYKPEELLSIVNKALEKELSKITA